jgi:hypothetical protein
MSQIRLTRTEEIDNVLSYLRGRYPLMSEAEIIKMVLSEKYQEKVKEVMEKEQQLTHQLATNVIDLEAHPNIKDVQAQIRVPRKQLRLLSIAGSFKGAKDLSSNKKKYSY